MRDASDVDDQKLFSTIYTSVIALLARREHSVSELTQKLSRRYGASEPLIEQAISKASADGYQSDERFAEAYARSRVNKGFGRERIASELAQKGITSDLIEQALASMQEQGVEREAISRVWEKKFSQLPRDFNEKMKQIRFLRYRGFTQPEIERLFSALESAG